MLVGTAVYPHSSPWLILNHAKACNMELRSARPMRLHRTAPDEASSCYKPSLLPLRVHCQSMYSVSLKPIIIKRAACLVPTLKKIVGIVKKKLVSKQGVASF